MDEKNTTKTIFAPVSVATSEVKDRAEKAEKARKNGEIAVSGLMTGYHGLDSILHGIEPGALVIVGADTGVGKSALAINLMLNISENTGVLYASLEMPRELVARRMLTAWSGVQGSLIKDGNLSDQDWQRLSAAIGVANKRDIWIAASASIKPSQIEEGIKAAIEETGYVPGLIICDYLQLMQADGIRSNATREREVATISHALKDLALKYNTVVVALSQLSRPEHKDKERQGVPTLFNLRESGALAHDADVVLMLWQEEESEGTKKSNGYEPLTVTVVKNRTGEAGRSAWLKYTKSTQKLANFPRTKEELEDEKNGGNTDEKK